MSDDQVRVATATGEPDLTVPIPDVGAAGGPGPLGGSSQPAAVPPAPPAGMDPQFVEALCKLPFLVIGRRRMRFPIVGAIGGDPSIWDLSDAEASTLGIPAKVYIDRTLATTGISGTLAGLAIAAAIVVGPRIVADVIATADQARARGPAGPPAYTPATPPPSTPAAATPAPMPAWAPPAPAAVPDTRTIALPTGEQVTVKVNRDPDAPRREEWFK